ncbi:MAG: response regulator transcription factor [Kiritimatiellae bacterium]|nr:response regulator transcription factor [Kiritimatiellia bacterium]
MAIKIMLVDDHKIIRDGLRSLIEKQRDMEVVAEAADGQNAVKIARKIQPHICILDIGMPELNDIEATRQIVKLPHKPKVIGLSMHSDRRCVAQMLKAGAAEYILKNSAFGELAQAIAAVMKGEVYLNPAVAETVVDDHRRVVKHDENSVYVLLSKREREVLRQIAEGRSTKDIASALDISVKTVETHRRQIMEKLKLRSVAELTKYAVKEGVTDLEI